MDGYDPESVTTEELRAIADILGFTEQISNLETGWELCAMMVAHGCPSTHDQAKHNALRIARDLSGNDDLEFGEELPELLDLARSAAGEDYLYDTVEDVQEGPTPFVTTFKIVPYPEMGTASELGAFLVIELYCYSQEKPATLELQRFAMTAAGAMGLANSLRNYAREARSLNRPSASEEQ